MSESSPSDDTTEAGVAIGVVLAVGLVLPQLYWLLKGYSQVQDWEVSLWGFYIAAILALSYFYERKSFLFRGVIGLFRYWHFPRGPAWALVYASAFTILGGYYFARWTTN